jgi:cytochrome c oxidase subunit 2
MATAPGEYPIYCTQYCGDGHSTMRAVVIAEPLDQFKSWLAKASVLTGTPPEIGYKIWQTRGCNQCHSVDGTIVKAPTWKDLYGSTVKLQDGTSVLADEDYLHYVIIHPNSKPIPGFDKIMPLTVDAGLVTLPEVDDVVAYIKTISVHYKPAAALTTAPSATQTSTQTSMQTATTAAGAATQPSK